MFDRPLMIILSLTKTTLHTGGGDEFSSASCSTKSDDSAALGLIKVIPESFFCKKKKNNVNLSI